MAGIGEASAIISVAQIGIKASKTIFEFVGEVKDAPKEIRRIGRDICTTSERLEEIGRLIENNQTSRLFNPGGIASAVRCSNDCREIITQVNGLLAKGGWVPDSAALEKKDLDISLLDALRWPFVRIRLASPQADLEKVKASLSLLFNSVMATASSNPMQSEYALQIPKLRRWAEQAARKAEDERRRSRQGTDNGGRYIQREVHWKDQQTGDAEEDTEMRRKFVEYQVKLVKEEEERRAHERAAFIQAEKEAKRKAEDEARKRIEQSAIDQYKREQDDIKLHKSEKEQRFKEELAQLGLEPDKIQSIIDTTGFQELELDSAKQNVSRGRLLLEGPKGDRDLENSPTEDIGAAPVKAGNGNTLSSRLRLPRRVSKSRIPSHQPTDGNLEIPNGIQDSEYLHSTKHLQLWLVDLVSGQSVELAPSRDWLRSKAYKARDDEISHRLAKLKHPWRTAILDFLRSRNDRELPHVTWKLCFIGLPRRVSRLGIFGHRRGDCLVRLVLCQHKLSENDTKGSTPWAPSTLEDTEDLATPSVKSQTKTSTSKTPISDYSQRLRGALRHPSELEDKTNRPNLKKESREVSFARTGDSDAEMDDTGTIRIDMEFIGDDDIQRGTTTMDSNLFPTEALEELGVPWRRLEDEGSDDAKGLLQIPQALSDEQIEQLKRITMAKIIEGEVSWRKPPKWKLQETMYHYAEKKLQPPASFNRPGRPVSAADIAGDTGKEFPKPETNITNTSKTGDPSERLAKDIASPRDLPGSTINNLVPTGHVSSNKAAIPPQRSISRGRTDGGSLLRRSDSLDMIDRRPRERDNPQQAPPIVQEVITHHRHIDHGYDPERFDYRRERDDYGNELERPVYRVDRDSDLREVKRYDDRSYRYDARYDRDSTLAPARPLEREDRIIIRERERERSRPRYGDFGRERKRPRSVERERFVEREEFDDRRPRRRGEDIVIREVDRSTRLDPIVTRSPSPIIRRFTDERNGQITIRQRERPRYRDDRVEIIRRDSPIIWPTSREEREEVVIYRDSDRERRRRYDDESVERIAVRRYPDREREVDRSEPASRRGRFSEEEVIVRGPERRNSLYKDDIDIFTGRNRPQIIPRYKEAEREEYGRFLPPLPRDGWSKLDSGDLLGTSYLDRRRTFDTDPTNQDIISTTLGEFTTFSADPEDNMAESPAHYLTSPFSLNNTSASYAKDLKSAQQKLDDLLRKLDKANKDGDFVAASDLQFYAIPDVKAVVEELKASEARMNPQERIQEVDDSEQASATVAEELFKRNNPNEDNLQPRVVEISDGDHSDDLESGLVNGSARRAQSFGETDLGGGVFKVTRRYSSAASRNGKTPAAKGDDDNALYDD